MTVALRWQRGLVCTEIMHITPFYTSDESKPGFLANDDDRNVHYLVDEGITWVRGHVADDSLEGKALIAANALAPIAFTAFTVGVMTTAPSTFWRPSIGSNPTLSVGNNSSFAAPNPKNELGE